jgi:enoyl-CoA hydratase/carnithine racemase
VTPTLDRSSWVGTVSFRRGNDNFFDVSLLESLAEAMEQVIADGARSIVLRSDARHFCAGMDFSRGGPQEDGRHLYDVVPRLFAVGVPVVAAIKGAAIGGGLGLALSADFRVAAPESRFAANFARLGFSQGFALTLSLPAVVGQQRAAELLYTGRRISGTAAHEMGLCDHLVPSDDVDGEAISLATEIAASAPLAVKAIRGGLRQSLVESVERMLAQERSQQDKLMTTADFREGVRASRDRRAPVFAGV